MLENLRQQYANYLALRLELKQGLWLPVYSEIDRCIYDFKKGANYLWVANGFLSLGISKDGNSKYDYLGLFFNFVIWYSLVLPMLNKCLAENKHYCIKEYRSNDKPN